MKWTREAILDEARGRADLYHLVEAIGKLTTDPETETLIKEWFEIIEAKDD